MNLDSKRKQILFLNLHLNSAMIGTLCPNSACMHVIFQNSLFVNQRLWFSNALLAALFTPLNALRQVITGKAHLMMISVQSVQNYKV